MELEIAMNLAKSMRFFAVAVVLALLAAACSSGSDEAGNSTAAPTTSASVSTQPDAGGVCSIEGKQIAFLSMGREHPVIQIWAAGARDRSAELGADHTELLSQGFNPQDAIALGEQAIEQGQDGMVIVAFDPQWYPLIEKAADAEIPVVVTHFPIAEGEVRGIISNIATDVAEYGQSAAQAIGEQIGGQGTVAITEGSFNNTEDLAASSFTEEMAELYPDVKVLEPEVEGFDPPAAIAKASSILLANPDVVAAFSTTGAGATTWARAAEDSERDVVIISMDYTRPNLELVESGEVFGLVAQPLYEENYAAVDTLEDYICGNSVTYTQQPPAPIITIDNVQEYFALLDSIGQ
jgi:ribose transport system substrate-binding protein